MSPNRNGNDWEAGRKRTGNDALQRFGARLSWHLSRGTRPPGLPDTEGIPWEVKEFAAAVRADERSVRAWRNGKNLPKDLRAIEKELFGDNHAYRDFRDELRRLHRQARSGELNTEGAFDTRKSEIEPTMESRREAGSVVALPGTDMTDLIATEFQEAIAYFQIGAGQVVLVAHPKMALVGFRDLMDRLRAIDEADNQGRMLIWTLDLGRQDFDDPESRLKFMNVESLASRFRALKRFKEEATEARWNWLQSRAIVVLHDTRSVRPDVPRLPAFDPQHLLFSAIPPEWVDSPEFTALYGGGRAGQTNYAIFLRKSAEDFSGDRQLTDRTALRASGHYEFRYFGQSLLKSDENGERRPRSLRLNALGRSFVEALGTVFIAASDTLGLASRPSDLFIDGMRIDPSHAIEKLRHHGFMLLRLDDFLGL
jgi:hypothetical protein